MQPEDQEMVDNALRQVYERRIESTSPQRSALLDAIERAIGALERLMRGSK